MLKDKTTNLLCLETVDHLLRGLATKRSYYVDEFCQFSWTAPEPSKPLSVSNVYRINEVDRWFSILIKSGCFQDICRINERMNHHLRCKRQMQSHSDVLFESNTRVDHNNSLTKPSERNVFQICCLESQWWALPEDWKPCLNVSFRCLSNQWGRQKLRLRRVNDSTFVSDVCRINGVVPRR